MKKKVFIYVILNLFLLFQPTFVCSQAIEGHCYVDLGLPSKTLWATQNVGANTLYDCGYLFAWGETEPKNIYSWSNYKWCHKECNRDTSKITIKITKYCTDMNFGILDNKKILEKEDDAASVNFGGNWRMPTYDELSELVVNCNWSMTDNYNSTGVSGVVGVSNINKNVIFFPCEKKEGNDSYLFLWSSSVMYDNPTLAEFIYLGDNEYPFINPYRKNGYAIRAVVNKDNK